MHLYQLISFSLLFISIVPVLTIFEAESQQELNPPIELTKVEPQGRRAGDPQKQTQRDNAEREDVSFLVQHLFRQRPNSPTITVPIVSSNSQ
jgi:hypothetical protein